MSIPSIFNLTSIGFEHEPVGEIEQSFLLCTWSEQNDHFPLSFDSVWMATVISVYFERMDR
ncbi:hypothetical protein SAMN05421881_10691 [Nitrosomonas halophila]|uniref:Uncharacterized protein n=1 Tax=Nitrosomonas halophila TaxID=44576 RepID=A0A1H3N805_9PROT|nr:hypothetical protein SAMN05421881_10691 [Nitrosomonas halophila]